MNTYQELKSSACGINYYVIKSDSSTRPYGITAELIDDSSDRATIKELYFTEAEADACCRWLAENEVYPITLSEVLENAYSF